MTGMPYKILVKPISENCERIFCFLFCAHSRFMNITKYDTGTSRRAVHLKKKKTPFPETAHHVSLLIRDAKSGMKGW